MMSDDELLGEDVVSVPQDEAPSLSTHLPEVRPVDFNCVYV